MSASRLPTNEDFVKWRKQMEAVRKDIECIFGVLKGRFRILKLPILFHKKTEIDNMFFTCMALHNMLHIWDERDVWEAGVSWGESDGCFDDGNGVKFWGRPKIKRNNGEIDFVTDGEDFSRCGRIYFGDHQMPVYDVDRAFVNIAEIDIEKLVDRHTENEKDFLILQKKLVKHFSIQNKLGRVRWLRS
jgi:hypothetical protein